MIDKIEGLQPHVTASTLIARTAVNSSTRCPQRHTQRQRLNEYASITTGRGKTPTILGRFTRRDFLEHRMRSFEVDVEELAHTPSDAAQFDEEGYQECVRYFFCVPVADAHSGGFRHVGS